MNLDNDFDFERNGKFGAFLGDAICVLEEVYIECTKVKVRYKVYSQSDCKIVFKDERTKIKHKKQIKADGREHYINITLPEPGLYVMYISNAKKHYVQYEIIVLDG